MRLLAATFALAYASSASAQTLCGPRDSVLRQLAAEYREAPVGIGLASNGTVVELLTSASGSWTLLITPPRGPTCLMGNGEAWQVVDRKPHEGKS